MDIEREVVRAADLKVGDRLLFSARTVVDILRDPVDPKRVVVVARAGTAGELWTHRWTVHTPVIIVARYYA